MLTVSFTERSSALRFQLPSEQGRALMSPKEDKGPLGKHIPGSIESPLRCLGHPKSYREPWP